MEKLLLAFLLLVLFSGPAAAAPPDDCLSQISQAIENADAVAFEQAIDLDAIIDNSLKHFTGKTDASKYGPVLPMLLAQLNTQGGQAIKSMRTPEAKALVRTGVRSGAFAGRPASGAPSQGVLAPLFANASMGRKEIRGAGEPAADAGGWLMPFSLHDYGNDSDYIIVGRFVPAESGAKLAAIENLEQLFEQIQKEASQPGRILP